MDHRRLAPVALTAVLIGVLVVGCSSAGAGATSTGPSTANGQPRFGGHLADFVAHFGQPNDHTDITTGQYHFARYANSNVDGIVLMVDVADGADFETLVSDLRVQGPETPPWSLSVAQTQCAAYLPADATRTRQVSVASTAGQEGVDVVYRSASLASTFPATAFVDASQNPVAAGAFDVFYQDLKVNDPSAVTGCRMLLGTQQTTP